MVTIEGASAEDTLSGASHDADEVNSILRRRSSSALLSFGDDLALALNGAIDDAELAMSPVQEEPEAEAEQYVSRSVVPSLRRRRGGIGVDGLASIAQQEGLEVSGIIPIHADKHGIPETLFPVPTYCSLDRHASHSVVWRYIENPDSSFQYQLYFFPRDNKMDIMTGRIEGIELLPKAQYDEISTSPAFMHTLTVLAKLQSKNLLSYQFNENGPVINVTPDQRSKLVKFQSLVEAVTKLTSMLENPSELLEQIRYLNKQQLVGVVNLLDNVGLLRQVHKEAYQLKQVAGFEAEVLRVFEQKCPNSFARRKERQDAQQSRLDERFKECLEISRDVVRGGLPGSSAKHGGSVSKVLTGVGSHTLAST